MKFDYSNFSATLKFMYDYYSFKISAKSYNIIVMTLLHIRNLDFIFDGSDFVLHHMYFIIASRFALN